MSRWRKEESEISDKSLKHREWRDTEGGIAYKKRHAEYAKQWRKDNKEKFKATQKRAYYNTRLDVLQHYSGLTIPECKCCKEQIFEFLQIDHIEGDGAEHRRSIGMAQGDANQVAKQTEITGKKPALGGNGFVYWLKKNNYPVGFQVLCANCNYSKRTSKYCKHELIKGLDMHGNTISIDELPAEFPPLTRRRRGEAVKEADKLGITISALHARERALKKPKIIKEKIVSTHCKNGHSYADGNEYNWNGHKQCRQCKNDYKVRVRAKKREQV